MSTDTTTITEAVEAALKDAIAPFGNALQVTTVEEAKLVGRLMVSALQEKVFYEPLEAGALLVWVIIDEGAPYLLGVSTVSGKRVQPVFGYMNRTTNEKLEDAIDAALEAL